MIHKILIANRGEIARRIAQTCHKLGIATAAVYSDADANALHVQSADEAVYIGKSPAAESYLNVERLIEAARHVGADAVHPGFGFLSEKAHFAQAVINAGLTWIGPTPAAISAMGDKRRAKLMIKGVPLVPGYSGDDQSDAALIGAADTIGFPIMVKAAAGGGGKGMRAVYSAAELPAALEGARREASQAFGDPTLILERLIQAPRHIEIQIFGDTHSTVIALGERECTIQRRHQKVIEECPAVDPDLRRRMSEVAVSIGEQLGYVNAGTIEFLLDSDGQFYFMEMNTRLQVEHRVTEAVYKCDLVEMQIRVAEGAVLANIFTPPETLERHALEVRIYAEDAANEFLPTTGTIGHWGLGEQAAYFDSGVQSGDTVTPFYDPMLAKVVTVSEKGGRTEAIRRMSRALAHLQILGVRTNVDFLRRVIVDADFVRGEFSTGFIDQHPDLLTDAPPPAIALIAVALSKTGTLTDHWRNNPNRPIKQAFSCGGQKYEIFLSPGVRTSNGMRVNIGEQTWDVQHVTAANDTFSMALDGHRQSATVWEDENDTWWVHCAAGTYGLAWINPLPTGAAREHSADSLVSPMPGTIIAVNVRDGEQVEKGHILLIIEAMKMEHRIKAPHGGTVRQLRLSVGDYVQQGVLLLELQPDDR